EKLKVEPVAGLMWESKRLEGDRQSQPKPARNQFNKGKHPLSRAIVRQVFIGHNPITTENRVMSVLRGKILAPADGKYPFALAADDWGLLIIHNQRVRQAKGAPGDTRNRGEIELKQGWHEFELHHIDFGGEMRLSVAWERPDIAKFMVVPPNVFGSVITATSGRMERRDETLVADLSAELLAENYVENDY